MEDGSEQVRHYSVAAVSIIIHHLLQHVRSVVNKKNSLHNQGSYSLKLKKHFHFTLYTKKLIKVKLYFTFIIYFPSFNNF